MTAIELEQQQKGKYAMNETIAAIATAPGKGAIGIVRISGPDAHAVADSVFRAHSRKMLSNALGYTARFGDLYDAIGNRIDECVALVYRAPKSYTGENAVELMCHGGEMVCEMALRAVLRAGARAAEAGEFTRRAFLNGRLSLTEAEAVCDLIHAASSQGTQAAATLQGGALYQTILQLKTEILALQSHISAAIDFPEEDVEELDSQEMRTQLRHIGSSLKSLLDTYDVGCAVLRGVSAVIVGSPNVGKSTLLNLLAGMPKALVAPTAGTTRDVIEHPVRLGGTTLLLADTAGIRIGQDEVEEMGISLAMEHLQTANLVMAVFDGSRPLCEDDRRVIEQSQSKYRIAVINKSDLPSGLETSEIETAFDVVIRISAKDAKDRAVLDKAVADVLNLAHFDANAPVLANERQRRCADAAYYALTQAAVALEEVTPDVVTAFLSEAMESLAELSGENVSETLLDEIFARFCVGK